MSKKIPYGFKADSEKLISYLSGEIEKKDLLKSDQEKLDRIILFQSLLIEHKFIPRVIDMMCTTFEYSRATAYRDFKLCQLVFGNLLQATRDIRRAIAEDMIREDRVHAKKNNDSKALARTTWNYIRLFDLDKEDTEVIDTSHFEMNPLIIAVLPEQVGLNPPPEDELLEKVSAWWQGQAEDTEAEDGKA